MSDATNHQKSESCSCGQSLEAIGTERAVLAACENFRRNHRHETVAWICYHHDMTTVVSAIFDNELDALRHAVGTGYLKVAPIQSGEIGNLP